MVSLIVSDIFDTNFMIISMCSYILYIFSVIYGKYHTSVVDKSMAHNSKKVDRHVVSYISTQKSSDSKSHDIVYNLCNLGYRNIWLLSLILLLIIGILCCGVVEGHTCTDDTSVSEVCIGETQVTCVGMCCTLPLRNRTCAWTNLYQFNKQFYAFRLDSSPSLDPSLFQTMITSRNPVFAGSPRDSHNFMWMDPIFVPHIRVFPTCNDLQNFVNEKITSANTKTGPSAILCRGAAQNIGHALLDELYPIMQSMIKFHLDTDIIRLIIWHKLQANSDPSFRVSEEINTVFAGAPLDWMNTWSPVEWSVFETLVVGVGQSSVRTSTIDYEIPGRHIDGLHKYRDRFYRMYQVDLKDRNPVKSNRQLKVIMIKNKRDLGDYDAHASVVREALSDTVSFDIIDLSIMSFKSQLELFAITDIYVSGVGTAVTSSFLLGDHTAIINLGDIEVMLPGRRPMVRFWEENFHAGIHWARTFYANPVERRQGVISEHIATYVQVAAKYLRNGFEIPLPRHDNASPIGLATSDYFSVYPDNHLLMIGDLAAPTGDDLGCMLWAEFLVCRTHQYAGDGCGYINMTLMDDIKTRRGAHEYC
jgi:hypothetical protein